MKYIIEIKLQLYNICYLQGTPNGSAKRDSRKQVYPLGKRTEAEGTPSTLPQPTFTRQTFTKSKTSTSQQHFSPQTHSNTQPTRSVHKHGHGIACSTSHDKPSQVTLPKSKPSVTTRSSHSKTTALVKPSPR